MRLTLRNLLAYMDNNLKAEEAAEMGQKIEESEFASNLLKRVRDVMRRLRLAAPSVTGPGPSLDPNTVAEYLDHVLSPDRVPDFEKVCLDSDVHLAEVASCHQILSLVLREPAEVDPNSRQKMYQLPQTAAAVQAAEAAGAPPRADGAAPGSEHKLRAKPEVPAYLRDPLGGGRLQRRWLPVASGLALAVLVGVILLVAFHQFEPGSQLCKMLGIGPVEAVYGPPGAASSAPAAKPAPGATSPAAAKSALATEVRNPVNTTSPDAAASGAAAKNPASGSAQGTPATTPGTKGPENQDTKMPPEVAATPKNTTPAPGTKPAPGAKEISASVSMTPPKPGATPPGKAGDTPAAASRPAAASGAPDVAPLPPERMGRLISDKQVLLQYNAASDAWGRVPSQAVVSTSVPLLAIPPYQPVIALMAGAVVHVQLLAGTQASLLPTDGQGVPGISVSFGRIVVRPLGEVTPRLRLQIGTHSGTAVLKNAETTLAVRVWRARQPGAHPENHPGPIMAQLHAASGEFMWEEGKGTPPISVPTSGTLEVGSPRTRKLDTSPDDFRWVANDETSWLDRRAAPIVEQALQGDHPASRSLQELVVHRQKEVALLSIRCLGYVGHFEPMVSVLDSLEQRAVWNDYISYLQAAIDRGPEVAAAVRRALEKYYPQDGGQLYRMLWGYSDNDLLSGEATTLVNYLNHDSVAFRVLAFYNLKRLNGNAEYTYKPHDPANKRAVGIQRWMEWRDRLPAIKAEEKKAAPPPTTPIVTPSAKTPAAKPREL